MFNLERLDMILKERKMKKGYKRKRGGKEERKERRKRRKEKGYEEGKREGDIDFVTIQRS